jgi:hypothetical protein
VRLKVVFVAAALLCVARAGVAQGVGGGAVGALFGPGSRVANRDRLDLVVSMSEAYERKPPPEAESQLPQNILNGGYSSMLNASVDYVHQRYAGGITARSYNTFQYYPRFDGFVTRSHNAELGANLRLSGRSRLEVTQTAEYSPSYLFRLFPTLVESVSDVSAPGNEYRADTRRSLSNGTTVTYRVGRAGGNEIRATFDRMSATDFQGDSDRPDLDTKGGELTLSRGVGRSGSFFFRYGYRQGEFGQDGPTKEQRFEFGASVSRALSRTRRARLGFNLTPSMISTRAFNAGTSSSGTLYRLEGSGTAEYPMSLRWSLRGSYQRGLEYIAVIREPVFRDSAQVQISGLLTERVDISASAAYAVGDSIVQSGRQGLNTYTGMFRTNYSLSRSMAVYGQYLYYKYDLHGQAALAPELAPRFAQQRVQIGVMLWARPVSR